MTNHVKIQGVTPRIQYTADGTTTDYEFPFAIFSSDDIDVYLDDTLQSTTSYSVTGIRHSDGGTVSFTEAPAIDKVITIVRNMSIERTTDFQEGGVLRADVLNDELDYQIACQQQIADSLNRTFVLPPHANGDDIDLSLPEPASGKAIVWNASGTGLENSTVSINSWGPTLNGYKQSAEAAASSAATYAQNASTLATNAATSATNAAASATAAAESVTQIAALIEGGGSSADSVTLTENQSIDGTKTFLQQVQTSTASEGGMLCLNSEYDFGNATAPSANVNIFRFEGQDAEDHSTGGVTQTFQTDGALTTKFGTNRYMNNDYVSAEIECSVDDTGAATVKTLTPTSATDASTQIATTKWIENQRKTGNGIGLPNWAGVISLASSTIHTVSSNGWIASSGSVRFNATNGKQIISGGALVMLPIAANTILYVSGTAASFYPSL
ncbi:MAG: hypothetical protein IKS41_03700 [Alphaproteobacteria bacterium]|nr:hypothetical protein [Alphaproteobacteria bacterium]